MLIIINVVAYFFMGLISEYMKGYAAPQGQLRTTALQDWVSMLIWFVNFPSTVGTYGAAKRLAAPGN